MKRLIPTLAIAAALATGVHAQDSKTTTRTQVKADDALTVSCELVEQGLAHCCGALWIMMIGSGHPLRMRK